MFSINLKHGEIELALKNKRPRRIRQGQLSTGYPQSFETIMVPRLQNCNPNFEFMIKNTIN